MPKYRKINDIVSIVRNLNTNSILLLRNSQGGKLLKCRVVLIYKSFPDMKAVRRIRDHILVWAKFEFSSEGGGLREVVQEY